MASSVTVDPVQSAGARARLRCWGDFALGDPVTGEDLKPRGRKARALIAYLALHPGKPVSRERLTGLLWGDRGEEQARASLRQSIAELRHLTNNGRAVLTVERDHLSLDPHALATDLDELRTAAANGEFERLAELLPEPDERLFANLDGLDAGFDDWLAIERTRQQGELAALIADASAAAMAAGRAREARRLRARLAEIDPGAAAAAPAPAVAAPVATGGIEAKPGRGQRWRVALLVALLLSFSILAIAAWQLRRDAAPDAASSIAVLPFRDLSDARQTRFADGVAEEVMAQLARQPGLSVAGRSASWRFRGDAVDPREVGRRLGVAYVLEGSVRSAGEQVRVNVSLVKASDGMQLWAQTFDGTLEDIFAIQARIGARVAATLQRRLARRGTSAAAPDTSGAVHTAYLTARALIRERNLRAMLLARDQLERALELDPGFAPAWSSLAQAKLWPGVVPGRTRRQAREEALADARRALALAPDLAEAHGVLGMLIGFNHPEGRRHIKRAVALDPSNAEFQFWLGNVHAGEADFPRMMAAYRRAFTLDPLWLMAHDVLAQSGWQMGYRREALDHVRRVEREGSRFDIHMARGFLANYSGDLSRAVAEFGAARAATGDIGKQARAAYARMSLLFNLSFLEAARREYVTCRVAWFKEQKQPFDMPREHLAHLALARGQLPAFAELQAAIRRVDPRDDVLMQETAERLINAGRAHEVVALYDSGDGLLGLSSRRPSTDSIPNPGAPVVASALMAVGREGEADRLLRQSDQLIQAALRRSGGRAPAEFDAQAAQVWALQGKRDAAIAAIERALRNGWLNADFDSGDLIDDLGEEPAFRSLRGDPRFERLRGQLKAHFERERRETRPLTL